MNKKLLNLNNSRNIPKHIVIIMDGNGRWAAKNRLDRISGHREGMKSVKSTLKTSKELGIKYLTLYAFSAQNWNRPKTEVRALMELLKNYLISEKENLISENIRLNAIGRLNLLPEDVHEVLKDVSGQ